MVNKDNFYAIDLHVHTGRYSQCAEMVDPYQIESYAIKCGLQAVLLTDHDMIWQDEELELLRNACPRIDIFRGIEVSAVGCHLVVLGIGEASLLDRGISMENVVNYVHKNNGAVILAHPFRDSDPQNLPIHLVDAIEIASTSFTREESLLAQELAHQYKKPMISASDAHALTRIGWAWTELSKPPKNGSELAQIIKSGFLRPKIPETFPVYQKSQGK